MDLSKSNASAESNISFADRSFTTFQPAKKSVLIKEKPLEFRMDEEKFTPPPDIENRKKQKVLNHVNQREIPDDNRTQSPRDSSILKDWFSNNDDNDKSVDSWNEKEYDFMKEGFSNRKLKEQKSNLENMETDLIEVLSEKNGEKMSEESRGEESNQDNSQEIFSKDNLELFKPENEGKEAPVDDIINFFMENSSKRTMLYQHGPVATGMAQKVHVGLKEKVANNKVPQHKIIKELEEQMKFEKQKREKRKQEIVKEKAEKARKNVFKTAQNKAPPVLSSILSKYGEKNNLKKFQGFSKYIRDRRANEGINMNKARMLMLAQKREEINRNKDEDFGETFYAPVKEVKKVDEADEVIEVNEVIEVIEDKKPKLKKLKKIAEKKKDINRIKEQKEERQERQEKPEKQETESDAVVSDDSQYFMLGDEYDVMIECHSTESDFVDIFEIKKREDDFILPAIKDQEKYMDVDRIVYPKKHVIHVGTEYQACISDIYKDKRTLCYVWNPERIDRRTYEEYAEKLSKLIKLPLARISEAKMAEILIDNNYDVELTLRFCRENLEYVKSLIYYK